MNDMNKTNAYYELQRDNLDKLIVLCRNISTCIAHFHRHVELLFVVKGEAAVRINNNYALVQSGGICFSDSFDVHKYTDSDSDNLFYTLIIPERYCVHFHKFMRGRKISNPIIEDRDLCGECILLAEKLIKNSDDEYLKQAYMDVIFGKLLKKYNLIDCPEEANADLMRDILVYIVNNYAAPLRLSDVAYHFGYSASHFSRIFSTALGCKYGEYVTGVRLKAAEKLFWERGWQKPESVIYECGFKSQQTFYRAFSEHYGVSPKKYFSDSTKKDYSCLMI